MLFDTHCHLNFKDFKDDADEVIARTLAADTWMVLVGSEAKTSARAGEYAAKYGAGVYAAIGLHPMHLEDVYIKNDNENGKYEFHSHAEVFDPEYYRDLALNNKKIVAIGEIGLEYYHLPTNLPEAEVKERQRRAFIAQLELARELKLPVIIHCREAHDDLMGILKDFADKYDLGAEPWGVIHCYSGNLEQAKVYWDLGLLTSFTGIITFSKNWDGLLRDMPLDKFLVETDSPYLAPVPFRGRRNEPLYVEYVARKIADLKGLSFEEIARVSTANAKRLFKID
jgi:TatD DNase family protein